MKFLAQNWLTNTSRIKRSTIQFIIVLITLLLFVLSAGAPMDDLTGSG
jgi:hypothetical protein